VQNSNTAFDHTAVVRILHVFMWSFRKPNVEECTRH